MGKRRKLGNINPYKRKKKGNTQYFNREKEINRLLNVFITRLFNPNYDITTIEHYKQMNEDRIKLKKLFDLQGKKVWHKSSKRKDIYFSQLASFKKVYTHWKHETYYIYLHIQYDVPIHLLPSLKYFRKSSKNIYTLGRSHF